MKSAGTPIALHFGSRYPFGHGLSYAQVEFADVALDSAQVDTGTGTIGVRLSVRNTGARARGWRCRSCACGTCWPR
jgi:beta-glucosidase